MLGNITNKTKTQLYEKLGSLESELKLWPLLYIKDYLQSTS